MQNTTSADSEVSTLALNIIEGWPDCIQEVPHKLQKYHSSACILTIEDGLILHEEAPLIPPSEQVDKLHSLCEGYQGQIKMLLHTKNMTYWPGLGKDVKQLITACSTCQHFQP